MDLTALLLRIAAVRPRVLVVPVPGGTAVRLAVEAELAVRGWPTASSPANTDLLIVAGNAGPELGLAIDTVWSQLPAPSARVAITEAASVKSALDAAADQLADIRLQGRKRRTRGSLARRIPRVIPGEHQDAPRHRRHSSREDHAHNEDHHEQHSHLGQRGEHGHPHSGHSERQPNTDDGHQRHRHDACQHEGDHGKGHGGDHQSDQRDGYGGHRERHGGHQHHHGEGMDMPGGLPMAELGEDRDGLALDQLHVGLGPVLPDWPAGLVLRVVLQGDVVQRAEARILDGPGGDAFWPELPSGSAVVADLARRAVARELDGLGRLLSVAGWVDPAANARRLRDELLADAPPTRVRPAIEALLARVCRSRTLRWQLRGVGSDEVNVLARLADRHKAVRIALSALDDQRPLSAAEPGHLRRLRGADWIDPDRLAGLLAGAELAAARLIVAAVDLHIPSVAQRSADGKARHA